MRARGAIVAFVILIAMGRTSAPAQRLLSDIPGAPESLLRTVSPKFYRTLLISPVEGWVVVRGQLAAGTHVFGARVIHSELGGAYDQLALDLAKNLQVIGYPHVELGELTPMILVHVLIYQIKDAKLALSFAHSDNAGGSQMRYYGCAGWRCRSRTIFGKPSTRRTSSRMSRAGPERIHSPSKAQSPAPGYPAPSALVIPTEPGHGRAELCAVFFVPAYALARII
jgi:hypothetical protein